MERQKDGWKDGRMDGRTDRKTLFYRNLPGTPGGPKIELYPYFFQKQGHMEKTLMKLNMCLFQ